MLHAKNIMRFVNICICTAIIAGCGGNNSALEIPPSEV